MYPFNSGTVSLTVPSSVEALPGSVQMIAGEYYASPLRAVFGLGFGSSATFRRGGAITLKFPDNREAIISNVCVGP